MLSLLLEYELCIDTGNILVRSFGLVVEKSVFEIPEIK